MAERGILKVHNALFVPKAENEIQRKGRSSKLISQRNECLLDRYLYYGRLSGKRYDLIIEELSFDFFLSNSTIADLLSYNYEKLSTLKKSYQELSEVQFKNKLKNRWPNLSW